MNATTTLATPAPVALVVRITDPSGVAQPYACVAVEPMGDEVAWVVSGEEGQTYRVSKDRRGRWRCACDGFLWRGRCKHVIALRDRFDKQQPRTEDKMAKSKPTNDTTNQGQPAATAAPASAAAEQQGQGAVRPADAQKGAAEPMAVIPVPTLQPQRQQQQVKPNWTVIRTMAEAIQLASIIGESNALPDVRNKGVALLKILAGAEMGFGPFASLTGVDVIKGKPIVGANLKAAAIKQSDKYDYDVVEQDEAGTVCEVAFFERVAYQGGLSRKFCAGWEKKGSVRMTIEQANEKGLTRGSDGTKNNWFTSPADMLFARCITKGQKRYCPDAMGGARTYDADELDEAPAAITSARSLAPSAVIDAEYVVSPPAEEGNGEVAMIPHEPDVPEWMVERFGKAAKELNLDPAALRRRLEKKYGTEAFRELKADQAAEALQALESKLAAAITGG